MLVFITTSQLMYQDQVFMCKWVIYGHELSLNIQIHIIEQLNDNKIKHEAIGTKFHHVTFYQTPCVQFSYAWLQCKNCNSIPMNIFKIL